MGHAQVTQRTEATDVLSPSVYILPLYTCEGLFASSASLTSVHGVALMPHPHRRRIFFFPLVVADAV